MSFIDEIRSCVGKSVAITDEFIFKKADTIIECAAEYYLKAIKFLIKEAAKKATTCEVIKGTVWMESLDNYTYDVENTKADDSFQIENLAETISEEKFYRTTPFYFEWSFHIDCEQYHLVNYDRAEDNSIGDYFKKYYKEYKEKGITVISSSKNGLDIIVKVDYDVEKYTEGFFRKKEVTNYYPNENWKKFFESLERLAEKDNIYIIVPQAPNCEIKYSFTI